MREIVVNVPEELFAYVTEWLNLMQLEVRLPPYKQTLSDEQIKALIASVDRAEKDYEEGNFISIEELENEEW